MSSRPHAGPFQVIINGDMSGNITSKPTIIQKLSMLSYEVIWSGTAPVGVISVEVSNTYSENVDGSVRNAGTWVPITLSAPSPVSGNSGSGFIDIDALGAYAVRLKYTFTSGVGTLQAYICGKVS